MSVTGITEETVATVLKDKLATEHVVRCPRPRMHSAACIFGAGVEGFNRARPLHPLHA
jgi:hypothetical protein